MSSRRNERLVKVSHIILAAGTIGLVLSPFGYIALGALGAFAPVFSLLTLPLLLASSVFLLYRFVWHQSWQRPGILLLLLEGVSWLLIAAFLAIISRFTLFTALERVSLFASLFLACSVISLPLIWLRQTAVYDRLASLPDLLAFPLALLLVLAAGTLTATFLTRPAAFL